MKNVFNTKLAMGATETLEYTVLPSDAKYKTVTWSSSNENVSTSIATITLSDGTKVECTPTHPLLTADGFKSVNPNYADVMKEYGSTELNVGDMVVTENGTFAVVSITVEQKAVTVYNFHVQSNDGIENCTYIANGIVVHNSSPT